MGHFMNKLTNAFFTGTENTSAIHGKSQRATTPWGKNGFNLLAWLMSLLLVLGIIAIFVALAYNNVGPEYLDIWKDMFRISFHILLSSTWTTLTSVVLYLLVLAWDDGVWSLVKYIISLGWG